MKLKEKQLDQIRFDCCMEYNSNKLRVVFVGKYPNWPENIAVWAVYPEVLEYWQNSSAYWKKYGRYHPLLSENAFDPVTGGYGDGHRYHTNFAKLGLTSAYADTVAFTELIGVPVSGVMNYRDPIQKQKDEAQFERLLHNPEHLTFLKRLLYEAEGKVVFVSQSVYNILKSRQRELFGLEKDILTSSYPMNHYEFRILHQHKSSYIISAEIFSSIKDESYYPRYRLMIDAVLENINLEWELEHSTWGLLHVKSAQFKELLPFIKEKHPDVSTLDGWNIRPIRKIPSRLYQLPILSEFFSNNEQIKWSIHCLIHSIVPIEEKEEYLSAIQKYYSSFKELLELDNQTLLDECFAECNKLIGDKDNSKPTQADDIRKEFYKFSFHNLKGLEGIKARDYYYAEKSLINTIWNTILDNLNQNGSKDKENIYYSLIEKDNQAIITILDSDTTFDFEMFVKANKSIHTYTKMNKYGEMTIESQSRKWSSESSTQIIETNKQIEGTLITLVFVLPRKTK